MRSPPDEGVARDRGGRRRRRAGLGRAACDAGEVSGEPGSSNVSLPGGSDGVNKPRPPCARGEGAEMLSVRAARGAGGEPMVMRRLSYYLAYRLVVLLAAATCLSAAPGRTESTPPPSTGGPAPNFALTTQQSGRLWLAELRGRAVVLAFDCTGCGACPGLVPSLADIARGFGDAPGRRILFVMVTVDPARDTPAVLRTFGRANGLRPPVWILLTEDRAGEVDYVARRYGVEVRRTGDHVETDCAVTVIDAAGHVRGRYGLASIGALPGDLRTLLGLPASP